MVLLRRCIFWTILLLLLLASLSAAVAAEDRPGANERCPVCGMFVAPFPNWLSSVTLNDGRRFFFDGPKDLFQFVLELPTYLPGQTTDDIRQVQVTEYYSTRLMDAREVFFVTGSNVLGPMGMELVPVAGKTNTETFLKDHGGKAVLQFDGRELHKVVAGD